MEYNTQRPHLIIREYGRNIQKMIDFACTIEDREKRNRVAESIIQVMGHLNPHLRDVNDFKHKLYDHLFIISDFKLDIDSPYPNPTPETFTAKPERIAYPSGKIILKHYGKTIEDLIKKAKTIENQQEKEELIKVIANLMKKFYLSWNRESVNDEVVVKNLKELSNGELALEENFILDATVDILARTKRKKRIEKPSHPSHPGGRGRKR